MALKSGNLISIKDLDRQEINLLLDTAESFKEVASREIKKVPTLRGKTIVNFFFEPSTRTRTSFELAGKRLSADVVNISATSSSMVKGESLLDAARNIEAMQADMLVIRHPCSGAPALLAQNLRPAVINAGDGAHEHPTQALLDCLTIRERKRGLEGLVVVMVGDVMHSRVARSDILALTMMGISAWPFIKELIWPSGLDYIAATELSLSCHGWKNAYISKIFPEQGKNLDKY